MGRQSTGAVTTKEVTRLELSYLLKQGYIRRGGFSQGILTWTNGNRMSLSTHIGQDDEDYIRLTYSFKAGGEVQAIMKDYKIYITYLYSNLGRGQVPYFVCPSTGRMARVLYMCYGSPIFKCRNAYRNRIYYPSQICSKLEYHNTMYWALNKEIEKICSRVIKEKYNGKRTRIRTRLQQLIAKKEHFDIERWNHIPKSVLKSFSGMALISELRK